MAGISPEYTDETHVFGVFSSNFDGLDAEGRSTTGRLHREGLTRAEAEVFLSDSDFQIVATPRPRWTFAEQGVELELPIEPQYRPRDYSKNGEDQR